MCLIMYSHATDDMYYPASTACTPQQVRRVLLSKYGVYSPASTADGALAQCFILAQGILFRLRWCNTEVPTLQNFESGIPN
jgi:hypothetical protein